MRVLFNSSHQEHTTDLLNLVHRPPQAILYASSRNGSDRTTAWEKRRAAAISDVVTTYWVHVLMHLGRSEQFRIIRLYWVFFDHHHSRSAKEKLRSCYYCHITRWTIENETWLADYVYPAGNVTVGRVVRHIDRYCYNFIFTFPWLLYIIALTPTLIWEIHHWFIWRYIAVSECS